MSASDRTVAFDVSASDIATELFLIDSNFSLAARGIGRATFTVPPGIYKLKARSGRTAIEKMIVVREGMQAVKIEPIAFPSPIPLAHPATPVRNAGSGSAIVIALREPAPGLQLRTLEGRTIAQIEGSALHVTVDPGPYRLSVALRDGRRVELTVIACPNLETHVYAYGADLTSAAVTIRKPEAGMLAGDPDLRLEEIARSALADDRKILSQELRERILAPDVPPMLVLLGAHLLIREAKDAKVANEDAPPDRQKPLIDNRAVVAMIVANLRRALGKHPDVEAIAIGAGAGDPAYVFHAPPMLRAGWRLLLKATAEQPHLVPPDSFAARIGERLWGDGPWLLFLDPDMKDTVDRSALWQAKAREELAKIAVAPRAAPLPPSLIRTAVKKVKSFFARRARHRFPDLTKALERRIAETPSLDVAALRGRLDETARRALVKRLGIPMSRIDAFLERLE